MTAKDVKYKIGKMGMKEHQYLTVSEKSYGDGEIILEEGGHGDWIYVVESGEVELSKMVGDKKVVIEVLKPGDVFGELGFITKSTLVTTCRAKGPAVVGLLDRDFLDSEYKKLSENFREIIEKLAIRLENTTSAASRSIVRRKDLRITKVLSLDYEKAGSLIKSCSRNVSTGGVFIETPKPYPVGETFILELYLLEDTKPVRAKCQVRWSRPAGKSESSGMGVKFVEMREDDQEKLRQLISDRKK